VNIFEIFLMRNLDNLIYRAEELGEVKIQYRLAVIYQTGDRVEKNPEQARHWYERAAEQGHEEAAQALARMGGKPVEPKAPKTTKETKETKAEKRGDSKVKSSAKEKSTADDLPPVIQRKPRRQSLDLESGLGGTTDCPHGHGPLQDWKGNLRCSICGWTDEQSETQAGTSARPAVPQTESATEAMGAKIGLQIMQLFGKKTGKGTAAGSVVESPGEEKEDKKKPGIGCDAVWVVGGIVYLLARSCSG